MIYFSSGITKVVHQHFHLQLKRDLSKFAALFTENKSRAIFKGFSFVFLFPIKSIFDTPWRLVVAFRVRWLIDQKDISFPDCLVISPGGVATTSLLKHVSRFVHCNDPHDRDFLKHLPRTAARNIVNSKIIYIYGDSSQIVKSLVSRRWLRLQSAKLGLVWPQFYPDSALIREFKYHIDYQRSFFEGLRESGATVMLLSYSDLWDRIHEISAFLEVTDPLFIDEFPIFSKRFT